MSRYWESNPQPPEYESDAQRSIRLSIGSAMRRFSSASSIPCILSMKLEVSINRRSQCHRPLACVQHTMATFLPVRTGLDSEGS
ncbi:hypothetical protein ElyMa_003546200 [Elysia marginata]|uniref:Uncharacterized protein n=1 Tax=Elysia marginata TaxID=1093978 RepID=A0AAV4EJP5_9GAST|nr:hypothetical protein ElyMa_003546200 [Elysia marginata]